MTAGNDLDALFERIDFEETGLVDIEMVEDAEYAAPPVMVVVRAGDKHLAALFHLSADSAAASIYGFVDGTSHEVDVSRWSWDGIPNITASI
jgi:hypothetical protein